MAAPYSQQTWVDNTTPVDAAHMSHIEQGIAAADDAHTYKGDWAAGTYYDGDIVVGTDGVAYLCVTDGTTTAPVPWSSPPGSVSVPTVVEGKYLKGVSGNAVWSDLPPPPIALIIALGS